jgi:hypothetical protein
MYVHLLIFCLESFLVSTLLKHIENPQSIYTKYKNVYHADDTLTIHLRKVSDAKGPDVEDVLMSAESEKWRNAVLAMPQSPPPPPALWIATNALTAESKNGLMAMPHTIPHPLPQPWG